jgi:hypothetical protein
MTLAYEAVYYDTGYVQQGNPPGFGIDHYDTIPSPISLPGGGTRTLLGQGGVLAGAEAVFGSVSSMLADPSQATLGNILNTAVTAINTYNNAKNLSSTAIKNELTSVATQGLNAVARQGISGLNNISFPINDSVNNNQTKAVPRNLGGGGP